MPKRTSRSSSMATSSAIRFVAKPTVLLDNFSPFGRLVGGRPRPDSTPQDAATNSRKIVALPPRPRTCPPRISTTVWNNVKEGSKSVPASSIAPKPAPNPPFVVHQRASSFSTAHSETEAIKKDLVTLPIKKPSKPKYSIPKKEKPVNTHSDHCAGTRPYSTFFSSKSTAPTLLSSNAIKNKKVFLSTVLDAYVKRH
jgi:hypothetical protein